ncbi:hypothetical protein DUNSADRAFT_6859 [Dunaliella salina]|uniref:Guanylate cyclase domain-containing protein n=1 Tax=Dunaliella salina TaxID=3046 RepID=A0ABQ7GMJ3_DUNSA|nr:hypothetical protein DUNSADRAFT_6859 [Dunaliella salina]|eukprot:KAF5835825.1 hypothetical protein DUNSADRAFT_6859 [Dunaliella salina]
MQPSEEGCAPMRRFAQSKSLSRLAASSSDQSTAFSCDFLPTRGNVQLGNRSASTRVSKSAVTWDIPSPPTPACKPPARSGSSPHEALPIESWQLQPRHGSLHLRGPPSVRSSATSPRSSGSGSRRRPLRSSSAGQLYMPAHILTIDPGSETTHASMSSNSAAAPVKWLDSGSWRGTSNRDRSSQPSHNSQSTNSRSTYFSGNSNLSNLQGPPQLDQQGSRDLSLSFGPYLQGQPQQQQQQQPQQQQQQQQQQHHLLQPHLLRQLDGRGDPFGTLGEIEDGKAGAYAGAALGHAPRASAEDLAESSISRNPGRDTTIGRQHALEPQCAPPDAASNVFEATSGCSSSSPEDVLSADEGDTSDATPPPSAFSIMAAALGWSLGYTRKGGPPARLEGDMFGQPAPAERVGRAGMADFTWEEQRRQTSLGWLAKTHQLERRGTAPCEDTRQAERSSAFAHQVGDAWGSQSPHTTPLYQGSSLHRSSSSACSSVLKSRYSASHKGSHIRRTRSLSKQSSGHSRRSNRGSSPPPSLQVASTLHLAQQQPSAAQRASATHLLRSGMHPTHWQLGALHSSAHLTGEPISCAPFSSATYGAVPHSSAPYTLSSGARDASRGAGTEIAAGQAMHTRSLGFATSPAAVVTSSSCNTQSNSNKDHEKGGSTHACIGQQSPWEEMSEPESLPLRPSPRVSDPLPSNPLGLTDRSSAVQGATVQQQQQQLLCARGFGPQQLQAFSVGLGDNESLQGTATTTAATSAHGSTLAIGEAFTRNSTRSSPCGTAQEHSQPLSSGRSSAAQALALQAPQLMRTSTMLSSDIHTGNALAAAQLAIPHAASIPPAHSADTGLEVGGRPSAGPYCAGESAGTGQAIGAQQSPWLQGILGSPPPASRSLTGGTGVGRGSRNSRQKRRSAGVRFKIASPTPSGRSEEAGPPAAPDRKDSTDIASNDPRMSWSPSRPSPFGGSDEETAGAHPACQRVAARGHSLGQLKELGSKKASVKHTGRSSGAPTARTSVDSAEQSPRPHRPVGPPKAHRMPKQLPYYSDLARHQGRYKVLLVTSDEGKATAIREALPAARYQLIVASSKGQCMSYLTSGVAKYMPDILLLDSRWRAAQAPTGNEETDVPPGSLRSSKLEGGKRWHRQHTSPALELLVALREYHDPSVLPIILLAAVPLPNTASTAAVVLKNSASRAAASAPITASATNTAISHGQLPWSPSIAPQVLPSWPQAQVSPGPGSLASQERGPCSWSPECVATPAAFHASVGSSHSAPLPASGSSTAPHAAPTPGQQLSAAAGAHAAAASLAAPWAASEAAAPSHQFPGLSGMPEALLSPLSSGGLRSSGGRHESWLWDKSSVDTSVVPPSPPQLTVPSTADPPFLSLNNPLHDLAVQQQPKLPQGPPPTSAAAAHIWHPAAAPLDYPQRVSAPHPAVCAPPFLSSTPSMTGALEQTQLAVSALNAPSAAQEGVTALRQGANDYVTLPMLDPAELEARISMQVALRRAVRIKAEASSSMQLLRSMLPSTVIRRLKSGQTYIAQRHEEVTIGFIDVVGFTDMSAHWPSSRVAQVRGKCRDGTGKNEAESDDEKLELTL